MPHTQSTVIKATFIGGLIGAVIALILAPHSGKETRRHLRRASKELLHREQFMASETPDEAMSDALHDQQEEMRLRREHRRQMPVLNTWEREL